jgi:hypothetical protein
MLDVIWMGAGVAFFLAGELVLAGVDRLRAGG